MTVALFVLWLAVGIYVIVCLVRPLPPFETRTAALVIAIPVFLAITVVFAFLTSSASID
jgi:hypothetical protein